VAVDKNPLRRIFAETRPAFLLVAAFSLFINLAMLVVPIYMLQVYDRVLTSMSHDTLLMLTLLAGGLLFLSATVEAARSRILIRVGAKIDARLSEPLFTTILTQQLSQHRDAASQPLRDLNALRTFLTGSGLIAFFDAPWTPIYLALIFMFHPVLGGIAALGAFLIVGLALLSELAARRKLIDAGVESRKANDLVEHFARNVDAIHAMGMVKNLQSRWLSHHDGSVAWQALASESVSLTTAAASLVRMLLQIAILSAGAWLALEQAISPGVIVAASIIMGRALAPVQAAIGNWRNFLDARSAYTRLSATLKHHEAHIPRTKLPAPKGLLAVEDVTMRLPGASEPLLFKVCFALSPGESLGLIGPTGAGKSTLARLLVGVWKPSMGKIGLDGADISSWPKDDLGPYIGYMPQSVELLQGTVAENIARFGEPDADKIVEAAKLADAHDLVLSLPDGYDTVLGYGGHVLSGGQSQRIALARAVFNDPRFVVLDEPNANLDGEGEVALKNALVKLRQKRVTTIVISHRPSLLAHVDKLLMLREGRVDLFGLRADIMARLPMAVPEVANGGNGGKRGKERRHGAT